MPKTDDDPEPSTPSILVPDVADGDPVVGPVNPTIVPDSPDGDPTYVKPTINYEDYDGNNKKYTPKQDSKSDSSTSSDEKIERQYEDWDGNGKVANATHTNSDGETDSDSEFTLQDLLRSYVTSNTAGGSSPTNSYNGHVRANNTQDNSPSVTGDEGVLGQSESSVDTSSASSVGQSSQSEDGGAKAYEVLKDILENNSNTIIPSVGIVLIALFLLVVGYRRKQSDEN